MPTTIYGDVPLVLNVQYYFTDFPENKNLVFEQDSHRNIFKGNKFRNLIFWLQYCAEINKK